MTTPRRTPTPAKVTNYGKHKNAVLLLSPRAHRYKAVENGDLEKGLTSNIEQTSVMSYLITSISPFVIILALFWWLE